MRDLYQDRIKQDLERMIPEEPVITILEDMDFGWYPSEIKLAKKLWNEGKSIYEMASRLRPSNEGCGVQETFLLVFHLLEKGKLQKRKNIMEFYYPKEVGN